MERIYSGGEELSTNGALVAILVVVMLRAAKHPYRPAGVVNGFLATNDSDTGFLGCYRDDLGAIAV